MLFELFLIFFKIGLFVFGGGYAMISFVENECAEKRKWLSFEEFQSVCAIAESTPGPIAINLATYVGQKRKGFWGAFFATLGVVTPSFIIIYLISLFFDNILEVAIIANAFKGIKVAVGILIFKVALGMIKKMQKNTFSTVLMVVMCTALVAIELFSLNFSSLWLIAAGGISGLFMFWLANRKGAEK